jgi:enamine deaminase RidA (YjgF/YER057c/UK114 family)
MKEVRDAERRQVPVTSSWGEAIGYSRAVSVGNLIFVSGTTATGEDGAALHPGDAGKQAETVFERIGAALQQLDAGLEDVVQTQIYLTDIAQWEAVGRAHGKVFSQTRPTTTMVQVGPFIAPGLMVEISAVAKSNAP